MFIIYQAAGCADFFVESCCAFEADYYIARNVIKTTSTVLNLNGFL